MKLEIIDYGAVAKNHLPKRARPMDAGANVYAPFGVKVKPGDVVTMPLGFGVKIPNGYVGFIFPRSSLSAKGIVCELPPIDPSYTGEIHAVISNCGHRAYRIHQDDKIGQLVIMPCVIVDFVTESLDARGANGFGSTGR